MDNPVLPESPVAPNRAAALAGSAALGLLLGALIAAWREWSNDAISSIRQLKALTPASSILGAIPLLEDELAIRRRRRVAVLGWASASLLSLFSIAGSIINFGSFESRCSLCRALSSRLRSEPERDVSLCG